MKFSTYLLAIFLPPFYLYSRKHYVGGTVNLVVWLIAWCLLITIIGAFFSIFPYFFCLIQAVWYLKQEMIEHQATMFAGKMATAMKKEQQSA